MKPPKRLAKDDKTGKTTIISLTLLTKIKTRANNADDDDEDDDPECFYCGEVGSKSRYEDGWTQCSVCK